MKEKIQIYNYKQNYAERKSLRNFSTLILHQFCGIIIQVSTIMARRSQGSCLGTSEDESKQETNGHKNSIQTGATATVSTFATVVGHPNTPVKKGRNGMQNVMRTSLIILDLPTTIKSLL